MGNFETRMKEYISLIDNELDRILPLEELAQKKIIEAMRYSLMDGGKRIRPILALEFCYALGGDIDLVLPFACSVEMIHAYSLIHDDLPCMDDDDMRRGKPSNHKVYGEALAILAGDALLTLAFENPIKSLKDKNISSDTILRAMLELSNAAGYRGMIGGQVIDLENEGKNSDVSILKEMDRLKTGSLIACAAKIGCIIAEKNNKILEAANEYASNIGLAFQIMDDILDATASEEELGKPVGSDCANVKSTYISKLGVERARMIVNDLTQKAKSSIDFIEDKKEGLIEIAEFLANRKK